MCDLVENYARQCAEKAAKEAEDRETVLNEAERNPTC